MQSKILIHDLIYSLYKVLSRVPLFKIMRKTARTEIGETLHGAPDHIFRAGVREADEAVCSETASRSGGDMGFFHEPVAELHAAHAGKGDVSKDVEGSRGADEAHLGDL